MNIVILSGSPRKGGTTDKLVASFTEGAESVGKQVTLFRVADMKIKACVACDICKKAQASCVHTDDMVHIYEAIRKADVLVYASPVYWFTVSAQLKLALDRIHAISAEKLPVKQCALLMTCADAKEAHAEEGAVVMYKSMLSYMKWENAGIVIAAGLEDINAIDGRDELEQARKLGKVIG